MLTEFDSRTFRGACGQFLTGVTVVTARTADGTPVGLTANSFSSVSLDPPLVLVCIDKRIASYQAWVDAPYYAVHVLAEDQEALSTLFATRGADKYGNLQHTEGLGNVPILAGAIAVFQCRTVQQVDAGDHTILIGQVEAMDPGDGSKRPLGFFRGKYTGINS